MIADCLFLLGYLRINFANAFLWGLPQHVQLLAHLADGL